MVSSSDPSSLLNSTVKELADHSIDGAISLPPNYFTRHTVVAEAEPVVKEEIPTIDISPLKNGSPDERSKIIRDIGQACEEWGCFNIVNHGIPESLRTAMREAFSEFFNLSEQEKEVYKMKNPFDPICHGTSTNLLGENVRFWRDFLRVFVYPAFHYPVNPPNFRAISEEYARQTRAICNDLLEAIWESLELDVSSMEDSLGLKPGSQSLVGNFYPPCPQPELVLGLPPHSDPCLLSLLMQNGDFNGLQVFHDGKWVVVELDADSLLFIAGDIVEIVSNGKYKSVFHRAMASNESTRISIVTSLVPPFDNSRIAPAPKFLECSEMPTAFRGVTFREFFALKLQNKSNNSAIDLMKV